MTMFVYDLRLFAAEINNEMDRTEHTSLLAWPNGASRNSVHTLYTRHTRLHVHDTETAKHIQTILPGYKSTFK